MPLLEYNGITPDVDSSVFIAPTAWVTGDVTIGANSSLFFSSIIRGDILPVRVGEGTNLQEHVLLHTSHDMTPCEVGNMVTIGHGAIVHGCRVEDLCIIGMHATILDMAVIGAKSIVGAGALITKGKEFPPESLIMGMPAKVVRKLTKEEIASIEDSAKDYIAVGNRYKEIFNRQNQI